jgi:hypothetical protein
VKSFLGTIVIGSVITFGFWSLYRTNRQYEAERVQAQAKAAETFEELRKLEAAELESMFRPFVLYKPGQVIDLIDRRLTVHEVEYFSDGRLKERGQSSEDGLAMRISLHNISNVPIRLDSYDFAVEGDNRKLFTNTEIGKEPGIPIESTLAPGAWAEGYINFVSDGSRPLFLYYREFLAKRPLAVIDIE